MKELSIEEKATRYDEALEKSKRLYEQGTITESLCYVFPELKESEDERIRKDCIKYLDWEYQHCPFNEDKMKIEKCVAWLEKQDSHYTFEIKKGYWYKCVCDYMLNGSDLVFKNGRLYYCRRDWRLGGEIDERNVKDIGVNGYKSFFRPATNQEIKDWLEKQGDKSVNIDIESIVSLYKQRLKSQGGIENSPLVNMCLTSFRRGVEIVLEELNLEKLKKQGERKPVIKTKTPEESLGIGSDEYNKIVDECIYGDDKSTWSEEDGRTYKSVLYAFEHNYPLNNEQQKFIKSLKERIKGE